MTGNKKVFDEPVIRAKINKIRFPKYCPVCGEPATNTTAISTRPQQKSWLRPHWDPAFYARDRQRLGLTFAEKKSFLIQVCENHHASDDAELRMRSITALLLTIVASVSIFVIMFAGADVWAGRGISPWVQSYFLVLSASFLVGFLAFRPNPLESAVNIIGFDFDVQYVWFKLKDVQYRNKFIEENEMNAELVNWIVKV
ncbi:MAG: hypothetical protein E4H14_17515 [Candidatus Thorarchaeota archaeon]|nr:MAG: hypothetical protein E4H14_17515 [Candidatus Thorarchaeota archaeon]